MRFLPLAFLIAFFAPAASGQTLLEWNVLEAAQVVPARGGGWAVRHPMAAVRAEGETVRVSGHMVPLETGSRVTRFAVSRMTAEECFYCMPSANAFVEVQTDRPVAMTTGRVVVTGTLSLPARGRKYAGGTIYRLSDAQLTRSRR
ncbi:MAG: hypothetical protein AAGI52_07815 [Bacteroidota bacterium]